METTLTDRVHDNAQAAFALLVRYHRFVSGLQLPAGEQQLDADQLLSETDTLLEKVFRVPHSPKPMLPIASESLCLKRRYEV